MNKTVITSFEAFCAAVPSDYPAFVPIEVEISVDDPYEAYLSVRNDEKSAFLETTGDQPGWGYFVVDPNDWMTVYPNDERDSFSALQDILDRLRLERGSCTVPYPCGAFGWISYDVAREIEDIPDTTVDDRHLPRIQFGIYSTVVSWKRDPEAARTRLHITCCPETSKAQAGDLRAEYNSALNTIEGLIESIQEEKVDTEQARASDESTTFKNEVGRAEYESRVRRVKGYIRDGETFQANISQRLVAPAKVHPTDVYRVLRQTNPAPYSGLVEFPGVSLISASPELLLDLDGSHLLTEPIAGTRKRGSTPKETRHLEQELLDSEKEHAEHAMLVDLQRNDLGKVSQYGSVRVDEYRRIDRYSEVMHTVSAVEGTRRSNSSVTDSVRAVFPGGTITGAPKPRTMEIIDEVESTRRGPYTGSVGIFGFDDRITLNMTIRTLVQWGGKYYLRVGAGIVHDSDPTEEFRETLAKGQALVNAVDEAFGDESTLSVELTSEDVQ